MVGPHRTKASRMANIYKRGNTYWARAQRNGREFRQSLKTTRRDVADKRLREWLDRMDAVAWGDRPRLTFDEAMEHFIEVHLPHLKPASARRYLTSIRMMIPHFEGQFLDQITRPTLREYVDYRRREGASAPTIRRDLACLSSMFAEADMKWEDVPNPVPAFLKERKRRGGLRESPPRKRYLSIEEEERLIAAANGDLSIQIAFAIDTGLRLEEQMSLTWDQVNLQRREITIQAGVAKTESSQRAVPLLDRAVTILGTLPRHLRHGDSPDWVFCKRDGTRYGKRTRGLAGAAKRALITDLKWHDLRRTCGCRLLQDHKMKLEDVRDWLGHSSVAQTERAYAFLTVDQLHEAVGTPGTKSGTGRAD